MGFTPAYRCHLPELCPLPVHCGENIGVGDVEHLEDQARWQTAAERAWRNPSSLRCLRFPDSVRSLVQGGQELSGGEWQKIALPELLCEPGQISWC